mgnify:CR=1 FL=1
MYCDRNSHLEHPLSAVLAGWAAGYAMGVVSTLALTFLATRVRDASFIERWVARDVPGVLLAVPLFTAAGVGWSFLGLLLGSFYEVGGFAEKPGIAGAPSGVFLLIVVAFAWLPLPPLLLFARRYWWLWCGLSTAFVGLFGWMMPLLAGR